MFSFVSRGVAVGRGEEEEEETEEEEEERHPEKESFFPLNYILKLQYHFDNPFSFLINAIYSLSRFCIFDHPLTI